MSIVVYRTEMKSTCQKPYAELWMVRCRKLDFESINCTMMVGYKNTI